MKVGTISRKFKMLHSILITFDGVCHLKFLFFDFCFCIGRSLKEINKQ